MRHLDALRVERHDELGVDKSLSDIDDPAQRYSFPDDFLSQYVDDQYDLVLVDVPGSTSNVAANALWATKHVFTPVRPSLLDTKQAAADRHRTLLVDRRYGSISGQYVGGVGPTEPAPEATNRAVRWRLWRVSADLVDITPDWPTPTTD